MPTRPRRRRRVERSLTDDQVVVLLGARFEKALRPVQFPTDEHERRAWRAHREELLSWWLSGDADQWTEEPVLALERRPGPGSRPAGWWRFEAPEPLEPRIGPGAIRRRGDEFAYLAEHDLLEPGEVAV